MSNPKKISPKQGEESVWDYPRPPRLEKMNKHIRVIFNNQVIADSHDTYRVLETSHPPNYYIPLKDIVKEVLILSDRITACEWKGLGSYYHIQIGNKRVLNAAWYYHQPNPDFIAIKDYVAFYPGLMDSCWVNDELVIPQPGEFYGGWITKDIVGPFKGIPGSWGW